MKRIGLALGALKPLPVSCLLSQRSYRIGCEQGVAVIEASVIDRLYRWVVTLELSITVEVNEPPVVPRRVIDRFGVRGFVESDGGSEGFGDRSVVVEVKQLPRLLIRRQ